MTRSTAHAVPDDELGRLAAFRGLLRQFHSFSESASGALGLTAVQYEALLAIYTQRGDVPLTVKALAQFLLIKHNSAVGLVDRIEQLGLVVRRKSESDRRSVVIELTARGKRAMSRLAVKHRRELERLAPDIAVHLRHFARPLTEDAPANRRSGARD